jgi:phosphate transport system permease protein
MTKTVRPSLYVANWRDRRRALAERAFKWSGLASILIASGLLVAIIGSIIAMGVPAFFQHEIELTVSLEPDVIDARGTQNPVAIRTADYRSLVRDALVEQVPDVEGRQEVLELQALVSPGAEFELVHRVLEHPALIGTRLTLNVPVSDEADQFFKHGKKDQTGRLTDLQRHWLEHLQEKGTIHKRFNARFLTGGDSSEPELAGVAAGVLGSFLALVVALAIAVPAGVATAIYLEEFAPKNRIADFVEANINNLAAVPSIVFGLLGLAILINAFGLPRSAPLVGGIVLGLMTLPTVIIAARASVRAIPSNIYEGALAVGASRLQAMTDHVLPSAAPGIVTGVIIGLAQALGETAPLLMIGMVAFVVTPPMTIYDPSSALPVLIYLWAESPERAFVEKTAGAALLLLGVLFILNMTAVWLRRKFTAEGL